MNIVYILQTLLIVATTGQQQNLSNDTDRCSAPDSRTGCKQGWQLIYGQPACILHSKEMRNFAEAEQFCKSFGDDAGIYVSLNENMKNMLPLVLTLQLQSEIWLGLNSRDTKGIWQWSYDNVTWPSPSPGSEEWKLDKFFRCMVITSSKQTGIDRSGWTVKSCLQKSSVVCQKYVEDSDCDPGWHRAEDSWCIKFMEGKATWEDAEELCQEDEAFLLYFPNKNTSDAINHVLHLQRSSWISIQRDAENLNNWRWDTGRLIDNSLHWAGNKPIGEADKLCAYLDYEMQWAPSECSTKTSVMCMHRELGTPTNTSIQLNYHRPDKVFLFGTHPSLTCTSVGGNMDTFTWKISKTVNRQKVSVPFDVAKCVRSESEVLRGDDGVCRLHIASTLTLPTLPERDDYEVACFGKDRPGGCRTRSNVVLDCDWKTFKVVDSAAYPNLTVDYEGKPGPVDSDTPVTSECSVYLPLSKKGAIWWALYDKDNKTKLFAYDDSRIKHLEVDTTSNILVSQLKLNLVEQTSIACFTYNITQVGAEGIDCTKDNIFCSKSSPIDVELVKRAKPMSYLVYPTIALVVMFVGAILWGILCRLAPALQANE